MTIKDENLKALIYLWTRDGKMPVNEETEVYIKSQLEAIVRRPLGFSDIERAQMAERLTKEYLS